MKAAWLKQMARFDAMQARERWLVIVATLGGIVLLGYTLFVEPMQKQALLATREMQELNAQLPVLTAQIQSMQAASQHPDAAAQQELADMQARLRSQAQRMATFEKMLVAPQQMTALLEAMVGQKSGLQLLQLKTLPPSPVREKKADAAASGGKATDTGAHPPAAAATPEVLLYRHGVEITLEGSYQALTAYLERLEQAGSKLLWSQVSLSTEKHPHLIMKLTVFTLSLDRTWLIV